MIKGKILNFWLHLTCFSRMKRVVLCLGRIKRPRALSREKFMALENK